MDSPFQRATLTENSWSFVCANFLEVLFVIGISLLYIHFAGLAGRIVVDIVICASEIRIICVLILDEFSSSILDRSSAALDGKLLYRTDGVLPRDYTLLIEDIDEAGNLVLCCL